MRSVLGNRLPVFLRTACGFLLLALLAACGYAGARDAVVQTVSVPVERQTLGEEWAKQEEALSVAERLARDRQEEIAMLDSVIENAETDAQTRQSALAQKAQLAGRMEIEAQARACLSAMGYESAQVVSGAQMLTVLLSAASLPGMEDGARVISAVADQTGCEAQSVKIILTR